MRTKRPFDQKTPTLCLGCGTPIAGGDYCLSCLPPSALEGKDSWVRQRWFSGPRAEAIKRQMAVQETAYRAVRGLAVVSAALMLFWLSMPQFDESKLQQSTVVASRRAVKSVTKLSFGATNVT